jgi:hypothetical protein
MKGSPAFRIELNDRETVSAYDELPLWSAMFGLLLRIRCYAAQAVFRAFRSQREHRRAQ